MIRFESLIPDKEKLFYLSSFSRLSRKICSGFQLFQHSHISKYFPKKITLPTKQSGFSLIEMAVVLVILGFILGGVVSGLSSQREVQKSNDAQRQLEEIRNAIIGFVQINNRLPCPASLTSQGASVTVTGGTCTNPNTSIYVPYADLGIQGAVVNGVLVDPWLQGVNYRLTTVGNWAVGPIPFTTTATNFRVCSIAACPANTVLANNVIAVLFSTGDPLSGSVNLTAGTNNFLSTTPSSTFDDTLIWLSQPELVYAISKTR